MVSSDKDKKVNLVKIDANPTSPATEIEQALNAKFFLKTLKTFLPDGTIGFIKRIEETEVEDNEESFTIDFTRKESHAIQNFFDKDNNKFVFANRYISKIEDLTPITSWVSEIRSFFEN